jgi:hypothetical protein
VLFRLRESGTWECDRMLQMCVYCRQDAGVTGAVGARGLIQSASTPGVECLIGKQKKPILLKVTEPSSTIPAVPSNALLNPNLLDAI